MGDKYTGTTLIQTASPEDVNKAVLDLLKKTNEVSTTGEENYTDLSAQIIALKTKSDATKAYIVATGSDANGYYQKYSDMTMICRFEQDITVGVALVPSYRCNAQTYRGYAAWTFPGGGFLVGTTPMVWRLDTYGGAYLHTIPTATSVNIGQEAYSSGAIVAGYNLAIGIWG